MLNKYVPRSTATIPNKGRPTDPNKWICGPDPLTREKYYAFLKHRSQARFRGEDYALTWEDWQGLWSDDDFQCRGRRADDLCLSRIDHLGEWSLANVEVIPRLEHLKKERPRRGR